MIAISRWSWTIPGRIWSAACAASVRAWWARSSWLLKIAALAIRESARLRSPRTAIARA